MKKRIFLVLSLMLILVSVLAVVPASADTVQRTSDIVVDTNVFKGDYVQGDNLAIDSVIVWGYPKAGKYDATCEYGHFIYVACKDTDIDLAKGAFNPADSGKERFATRFDVTKFKTGVEYAVKTYVKDADGNVELSRSTAFFNVNDAEIRTITPFILGANITYDSQEPASNYAKDQINTQYFVYRKISDGDDTTPFTFLGATNELKFNVIDDLFDENGEYDVESYDILVKSVSGLNKGGASATYTFAIQSIGSAEDFMFSVGTDNDLSHEAKNVYQVLDCDIDLSGEMWRSWSILHDNWKQGVNLHSIIKYYADTLDGRGHKITLNYDVSGDKVDDDGGQLAGLFGLFTKTGFVRNLHYEITAKHGKVHTITGGERSAAFAMIGEGSYENCYMKAYMSGGIPSGQMARRDAFIGFPASFQATNVIAEMYALDNSGNSLGDIDSHSNVDNHFGTGFIWEGIYQPEANYFIMVDPITLGVPGFGFKKGKNLTYYNSMADVLTGTNGIICDEEGLASMDKGQYRSGTAYSTGWDSSIWEFNVDEGYIKFFDTIIYQAE